MAKDLAYLGNSLKEVREKINNLHKYKEQIRKSHKKINQFLQSNHYLEKIKELKLKKDPFLENKLQEVESCKLHFNKIFKKENDLTKQEILKQFVMEFAFNTTSIEGNTITLKETKNLLDEGITPKNKTLREIYDLQNTEKVFFSILKKQLEISHKTIMGVHNNLLDKIDNRVGGYRTRDVRVINANFKTTPHQYIKEDMGILLQWYEQHKTRLHPLVLATIFHHKLEKIHPFFDGNGRTGRMLLNLILLKNNYPPLIIRKKFRKEYLENLRKADKSGLKDSREEHYNNLVQFNADEMTSAYWNSFL